MEEGGQITEGEKASGDGKAGGRRKERVRGEIEREGDGLGREGEKWQRGTMRGSPSICLKATACPAGREPECVHSGLNNGCS